MIQSGYKRIWIIVILIPIKCSGTFAANYDVKYGERLRTLIKGDKNLLEFFVKFIYVN
jgi:hypothetical protein